MPWTRAISLFPWNHTTDTMLYYPPIMDRTYIMAIYKNNFKVSKNAPSFRMGHFLLKSFQFDNGLIYALALIMFRIFLQNISGTTKGFLDSPVRFKKLTLLGDPLNGTGTYSFFGYRGHYPFRENTFESGIFPRNFYIKISINRPYIFWIWIAYFRSSNT